MDDLAVSPISNALAGRKLDVIVGGSIGAIEAPRFIRSLRRLGADITAWPTPGSRLFLGPDALAWATGKPVVQSFRGEQSHLAQGDACILAPASANNLSDLAQGRCHTPALAVMHSHRGQDHPTMILANMHDSLANAPGVQINRNVLHEQGFEFLSPRLAEGKNKFPDPALLADTVAHTINRGHLATATMAVGLGPTRSYLDDVRFLSNYSSGALGTAISEEAYRQGYIVSAICGPAQHRPRAVNERIDIETNEELSETLEGWQQHNPYGAMVFASSVLDYTVKQRLDGKMPSGKTGLTVAFSNSPKIIAAYRDHQGAKYACKLLSDATEAEARTVGEDYIKRYGLAAILINNRASVSPTSHTGWWLANDGAFEMVEGKMAIANTLLLDLQRHRQG